MLQKNIALSFASIKSSRLIALSRQIMLVVGVAAITTLVLVFVKPEPSNRYQISSLFLEEPAEQSADASTLADVADSVTGNTANQEADQVATPQPNPVHPTEKKQQSVANWLAKRYRVADEAAHLFVSTAYLVAHEFKLDPLLILSVMAIESGLNPSAQSPVGAQGLMQVMSKIHVDKFNKLGGLKVALEPVANIRVGTQILKEYVTRGGSVEAGLKIYVGAALAEHDDGYGNKVLREYKLLEDVANGKPVPISTTAKVAAAAATNGKPAVIKVSGKINSTMNKDVSEEVSAHQAKTDQTQET